MTVSRTALAPAAIVVAAFAIRVHGLGEKSIWLDEGYTIERSAWPLPRLFRAIATGEEKNPPLHALIVKGCRKLAGDSDAAIRFPSVVFGTAAVLFLYLLAARLFGRPVALLSAGLLAISRFHVEHSQEARAYPLLVLLSLAAAGTLLAAARRGGAGRWALFVALSVLLAMTHVYGWFTITVLATLAGFALARGDAPPALRAAWRPAGLALAAALVPPLLLLLGAVRSVMDGFWIREPGLPALLHAHLTFAGAEPVLLAGAFLAGAAALGVVAARRAGGDRRLLHAAWAWLLLPTAIAFALSKFVAPILVPRYAIAASPALFVLAAAGVMALSRPAWRAAAIGLFAAASAAPLLIWYGSPGKEPWREAAAWVESRAAPGDEVLFHMGDLLDPCWRRYAVRDDLRLARFPEGERRVTDEVMAELDRRLADGGPTWLVLSHEDPGHPRLVARLEEWGTRVEAASWPGIDVARYVARDGEGGR